MFVLKYQPCPVQDVCLDYAGPLVSVAVIIVTIIAVVYCCLLQFVSYLLFSSSDWRAFGYSYELLNENKMIIMIK